MLFMTTYKFVGDRTPERTAALMSVLGERGEAEGTQAHYVRADSGGGWLIQEITDAATAYADALAYSEWLEIESVPILGMDEAAPKILESLAQTTERNRIEHNVTSDNLVKSLSEFEEQLDRLLKKQA